MNENQKKIPLWKNLKGLTNKLPNIEGSYFSKEIRSASPRSIPQSLDEIGVGSGFFPAKTKKSEQIFPNSPEEREDQNKRYNSLDMNFLFRSSSMNKKSEQQNCNKIESEKFQRGQKGYLKHFESSANSDVYEPIFQESLDQKVKKQISSKVKDLRQIVLQMRAQKEGVEKVLQKESKQIRELFTHLIRFIEGERRQMSQATPSFGSYESPVNFMQKLEEQIQYEKEMKKDKQPQPDENDIRFSFRESNPFSAKDGKKKLLTKYSLVQKTIEKGVLPVILQNFLEEDHEVGSNQENQDILDRNKTSIILQRNEKLLKENQFLKIENEDLSEKIFDYEQKISQIDLEMEKKFELRFLQMQEIKQKNNAYLHELKKLEKEIESLSYSLLKKEKELCEKNTEIYSLKTEKQKIKQEFKIQEKQWRAKDYDIMKKYDDLILKKEKSKLREQEESNNLLSRNKLNKEFQNQEMSSGKKKDVSLTSSPCLGTIKKSISRLKSEETQFDHKRLARNQQHPSSAKLGAKSSSKNYLSKNSVGSQKSQPMSYVQKCKGMRRIGEKESFRSQIEDYRIRIIGNKLDKLREELKRQMNDK